MRGVCRSLSEPVTRHSVCVRLFVHVRADVTYSDQQQ